MREQLEKEVRKRFGSMLGPKERKEMREEIVLNALDRYDEEIGNGASPEDAYETALQSVGDSQELNTLPEQKPKPKAWKYILFGLYLLIADFLLMLFAFLFKRIFIFALIGFAGIGFVLFHFLFQRSDKHAYQYLYILGILIISFAFFVPLFLWLFVSVASCIDPNAFY